MAYTLNGVAARIAEMDFETTAWKYYVGLCILAHVRGTTKKIVETRAFGTKKPSSNFNASWRISVKTFPHMSRSHCEHIASLNLDDAVTASTKFVEAHMSMLGVNGKNAYAEVAHYADADALNAAKLAAAADKAEEEAAAAAAAAAAKAETDDTETETPVAETPERDRVAEVKAIMAGMTADELNAVAVHLHDLLHTMTLASKAA